METIKCKIRGIVQDREKYVNAKDLIIYLYKYAIDKSTTNNAREILLQTISELEKDILSTGGSNPPSGFITDV